jgi:hypothetical protein
MSFIETEASYRIEIIDGKPVKIITPQTEVTLTNMKTGQEYNSDAEAMQDVQNPETETVADDIKRDVKVTVEALPLGGSTNLAMRQGNTVGPNPDLFFAPQSKIGGLMDFIPGIGTIRRGAEFLKGLLPINERAIMENEARGMGIFTDDIGRVVAGPDGYNTAQGIMAGYNLNKIDKGTFDKRRATINKAIEKRKASGLDYSGLTEKLNLLDEAEDLYLGPLKTRTDTIYKYRKDKKDAAAAAKAAEKEARRQEAERVAAFNQARADRADARRSGLEEAIYTGQDTSGFDRPTSGAYAEGAGMGLQGGYQTDYQGGDTSYNAPSSSVGYGAADDARESRRGRYFMNGGLVDLVDIYD